MSIEIKKEVQLEIAHVLFIDIVGSSKLSISDQHAAGGADSARGPKQQAVYLKSRPATGWRWYFTRVRKRLRNARWRSAARSRNILACTFGWESTAGQSAAWSMEPNRPILRARDSTRPNARSSQTRPCTLC